MKYRILFSPFIAYCISFSVVIPIYLLDWSYLFPALTLPLLLFFIITFSISILGALFFKNLISLHYKQQTVNVKDIYAILLILFYLAEFTYSRSIPLVALLNNVAFEDIAGTFGIPTFHVFVVGFTTFLSIHFFHSYLSQKKIKYLLYYFLAIFLTLLVTSRITLTFIFISSIYVYLMSIQKKFIGKMFKIGIIGLAFLAVFGVFGNIRSHYDVSAGDVITVIGEAKPSFTESWVPNAYFWGYLYIASPLANLQLNIDRREVPFTLENFIHFIIHDFFWDAISKRIESKYNFQPANILQINGALNVGSVYTQPYVYIGFWGMWFMYAFMFLLTVLFLFTLDTNSKYFITYLACFNTLIVLCIFDNIFIFTPLSLILIFPLLEKGKHFFIKSKPSTAIS